MVIFHIYNVEFLTKIWTFVLDLNIKDIVVYTVLMGEHEGLNDQPKINLSKLKHYCITDDINLKSDYWEMIYMDKIFPKDPHRSQRNLKIRPHLIFQDLY